jgi:hypothetical protein
MNTEKSLRDKYFDNEIFKLGDIVEDVSTKSKLKIIDRGANYVTVTDGDSTTKKWLDDIVEHTAEKKTESDFELSPTGSITMFGFETQHFSPELSEFVLEQFSEFDDLYSKHQIVKCLDYALGDVDLDRAYNLVEKVEAFYLKQKLQSPLIVEGLKTDIERRRLVEIIAAVADVRPSKTNYQTISQSIKALKEKYQSRKQWEVMWPLFKLAMAAGIDGIMQSLPYTFANPADDKKSAVEEVVLYSTLEDNLDLVVEDLEWEDINETFEESEFEGEDLVMEVLSIEARNKLSRKMSQHSDVISTKRARALSKSASSDVLLARARRLAETMVKRRMFHKNPGDLTRQEKERFESGISKRKVLIAKLAQRLVSKVRAIQSDRLHNHHGQDAHPNTPHTLSTAGAS